MRGSKPTASPHSNQLRDNQGPTDGGALDRLDLTTFRTMHRRFFKPSDIRRVGSGQRQAGGGGMVDYKFSQIRMQLVALADSDPILTDKGLRVLLRLLVQHLSWKDGTWNTTDAELAAEFGCSTDTISRAVASIERSGLLEVARGRWGRASQYSVPERVWKQALELRNEHRKIAEQGEFKKLQKSGISSANLRHITPQICGPTYKREIEDRAHEVRGAPAPAPGVPNEGEPGRTDANGQGLVFVPRGICFVRDWDDRLGQVGMPKLERILPMSSQMGKLGFWLPARIPASADSPEWQQQLRFLRDVIGSRHKPQHLTTRPEEKSKVTHVATPPAPCEGMGKPFPLDPKPGARMRARRLA